MPLEVRVSVDIGCHQHRVAIGLSHGEVLEEFDMTHHAAGFAHFFSRIATYEQQYACPVAVAMEGFNGQTPPIDPLRQWGIKLTGFFRLKPPLGNPHFSTSCIPIYYIM